MSFKTKLGWGIILPILFLGRRVTLSLTLAETKTLNRKPFVSS